MSVERRAILSREFSIDQWYFLQIYKKNHISNITFPIEETVSALQGPFASMIPSYKTVLQKAKDEFSLESAKEAETQTNKHDPGTNNLRIAV